MDGAAAVARKAAGEARARSMLVLDKQEFIASVETSLRDVLDELVGGLDEPTTDQIARSLRAEIRSLLRSRGRRVLGQSKQGFLDSLKRTHGKLQAEKESAREEVDSLERRLERVQREGLVVESTAEESRAMMERVRARLVESGLAQSAPLDLRRAILSFALDAATDERQQALAEGAHSREVEIERLQRRLAKLNATIEELEDTARELQRQLAARENEEADEAEALLRPRVDLGDGRRDVKKRACMDEIFAANLDLLEQIG